MMYVTKSQWNGRGMGFNWHGSEHGAWGASVELLAAGPMEQGDRHAR